MNEYESFSDLVPQNITNQIPEERMHHALWNLAYMIKKENPRLYEAVMKEDASEDDRNAMSDFIEKKWQEVMAWHVNNGFVTKAENPTEIKREPVKTDKQANQKILALVKKEYLKRIPFFVRGHATTKTCELIAREFPDLYKSFQGTPSQDQKKKMAELINGIFAERMAKHNM